MSSSPHTNPPKTMWHGPMYNMIPILERVAMNGEEVPDKFELLSVLGNAVQCIPQRAGWYITKMDPSQVMPSLEPMLNFREWQDLSNRPGWRFRILYSSSNEFKGRQIGFGDDPTWTAAIVIQQQQQKRVVSTTSRAVVEGEDEDSMQVDPPNFMLDFDNWQSFANQDPFLCDVDSNRMPLERSLLLAYYQQDVGSDGEGALSLQTLDNWKTHLPEVMVGDKIDLRQLQMVNLKVIKEIIDELLKLREELNKVKKQ